MPNPACLVPSPCRLREILQDMHSVTYAPDVTRGHTSVARSQLSLSRVPIVCVMKRAPPAATTWPDAVDEARQVYNRPVRKQGTLDARGFDGAAELVDAKLKDFIRCFSSRCVCPALSLSLLAPAARQRVLVHFAPQVSGPRPPLQKGHSVRREANAHTVPDGVSRIGRAAAGEDAHARALLSNKLRVLTLTPASRVSDGRHLSCSLPS